MEHFSRFQDAANGTLRHARNSAAVDDPSTLEFFTKKLKTIVCATQRLIDHRLTDLPSQNRDNVRVSSLSTSTSHVEG